MKPCLYIFSGLPGSGKTTISRELAKHLKVPYLRLDTVEHGLKEVCSVRVQGEGYRLTYRIAADNLQIGNSVVVDSCNTWKLTRDEWETVAKENGCNYLNIEIVCSDRNRHKKRIEERENDIAGFELPSWEEVQKKDYQKWEKERIILETSQKEISESAAELIQKIKIEERKFA